MKLIYVAGPFRASTRWGVELNIRRAEALALEVWRLGAVGVCVHSMCRYFEGAADDVWLAGDLELLRRCDAVLVTDDWERSTGAIAEVKFARDNQIPVFFNLSRLHQWLTA